MSHWLLKSEPETFGIEDLEQSPNQATSWEGVRNYQARNLMRDNMRKGDLAFFYHSSCKVPGVVGIVKIIKEGYPDETAHDVSSSYYDPKSTSAHPRWYRVDVKLVEKFDEIISLQDMRNNPQLQAMILLKKGNRLSVMPISERDWQAILKMKATIARS